MTPNILENVRSKIYSEFYQRALDDITIYELKSSNLVDLSLLVGLCRNLFFEDHQRLYSKVEQLNNALDLHINYVRYCSHKWPTCNARQMLEIQEVPTSQIPKVIDAFQLIMLNFHFKVPSGYKFPIRCEKHANILTEHKFRLTRINLSRGFAIFRSIAVEVELKFSGDYKIFIDYAIGKWRHLLGLVKSSEMMLLQPRLQSTDTPYIMTRLLFNKEKMSQKDAEEKFTELVTRSGFVVGKKIFPIFFLSHPKFITLKELVQTYRESIKDVGFESVLLRNTIDLFMDISKAKELSEALGTLLS